MNAKEINSIIKAQKSFFASGATLSLKFRKTQLKKLYATIKSHEEEIAKALEADLGKCRFESFMCEVGLSLTEISYMLRHIRKFAKPRRVRTPLAQFASKSYVQPSPYGTTLVMSPWNYPFLLSIEPLVDAIAAGNTAVLKPSAYSPATSAVVKSIIEECFSPEYVAVITGGRQENADLLKSKFDFVFFTGSQAVGREVLRHTAEHLTPAVLELGGKSPCIVDNTAKIDLAAKRIVFGKYLNCGQTCVAPDYILCDKAIRDRLVRAIIREIKAQYGEAPLDSPDYGKLINEKHFARVSALIDSKKVAYGGEKRADSLQISPTVLIDVTPEDAVMQEEIFGPLLPILTYESIDEIYPFLAARPKPLALYIFSQSKENIQNVTTRCAFGGGCVNDTIIHLATSEMGFGGVGESGMGAYHGKAGFDAFSHHKSIVNKKTWIDLPMRYRPYTRFFEKLLHLFLK